VIIGLALAHVGEGVGASFRSVRAGHMDNPIVVPTGHVNAPWIAAHLAVLNEAAVDVRLDVDFQLLPAKRTRHQKLVWHISSGSEGVKKPPHERSNLADLGSRGDELERRRTDRTGVTLEGRRQRRGQHGTFIQQSEQAAP
jgi:hypothetical protein